MPKKRVHEVAKELGLENKALIAHLEKIGIAVKTASSSLEESEVERIKKALSATEHRETVEERIKSTVIRRRTVCTFVEPPVEEVPEKKEEQPEKVSPKSSVKAEEAVKEQPSEVIVSRKESVIHDQHKEKMQKVEAVEKPAVQPVEDKVSSAEKIQKSKTKEGLTVQPAADETAAAKIKQPPHVSVKTPVVKHKIIRPESDKAVPQKAPLKPGKKIVIPPPEKPKKKGKATVEVFIEEKKVVPLRKILEKNRKEITKA